MCRLVPTTVDRIVDAIDQASKRYLPGCDLGDGSRRRCRSCVTQPHRVDGVDGGSEARGVGDTRGLLFVAVEALHHISHAEGEDSVFALDGGTIRPW